MVVLIFKVIFINSINILDLSKITTTSLVQPKNVTHSLTHKYAPFLLCIDTLYYTGYYTEFVHCTVCTLLVKGNIACSVWSEYFRTAQETQFSVLFSYFPDKLWKAHWATAPCLMPAPYLMSRTSQPFLLSVLWRGMICCWGRCNFKSHLARKVLLDQII